MGGGKNYERVTKAQFVHWSSGELGEKAWCICRSGSKVGNDAAKTLILLSKAVLVVRNYTMYIEL